MESRIAVLLGGRAAEMLIFGLPSTGAADDLSKATDIARALVTRYGMEPKLGLVAYEPQQQAFLPGTPNLKAERGYSEETAREIDCAVRALVEKAFQTATVILKQGRTVLERGAGHSWSGKAWARRNSPNSGASSRRPPGQWFSRRRRRSP